MTPRLQPGPWRVPAEWEPHERCIMAWPARVDLWGEHLREACDEYAASIEAVSSFEPVTVLTTPGTGAEVRRRVPSSSEVWEIPIDDSWTRDSGPIITLDADGQRSGADFRFNSWGEKYAPWDKDAASSALILDELGIARRESRMVLEGGAITVDGEGTLVTTEQCLLNPNRNPSMSRDQIEAELASNLGVREMIWLPWGLVEDRDTDGHVDGVAVFVRPGVILAQTCGDPDNPNFTRLRENLDVLRAATDAEDRRLQVIELPHLAYFDFHGEPMAAAYTNFYIANGGVVVPVADIDLDQDALSVIGEAFPDCQVIGVRSQAIAFGGGGTHCITQQIPQGREHR